MIIELSKKRRYGYDGSNLVFSGNKYDFFVLSEIILELLQEKKSEIKLSNSYNNISFIGIKDVFFKNQNGKVSSVYNEFNCIVFDLSLNDWQDLFVWSIILSRDNTFCYLEDVIDFVSDYNIIWSSENFIESDINSGILES